MLICFTIDQLTCLLTDS